MADLPTALEYTTVHVSIQDLVEDATAETRGKVTYTPSVTTLAGIDGKVTQVDTVRDYLIAGSSSVHLLTGITWTADFQLQGGIPSPDPVTFTTDGSTINLAYEITASGTCPIETRTVVLAGAATTAQLDELADEMSLALEDKADAADVEAAQAAADAANAALPSKANAADVYDKASADARYGALVRTGALPAGLGWNTSLADVVPTITETLDGDVVGDAGFTAHEMFDAASSARTAPTNTYYVSPSGNDSTGTGASGAPWRSITKAITAANASGSPARIVLAAGAYDRGNGFEGTSPAVDTAFIAAGDVTVGPILTSSDYSSFNPHATYTKAYYVNNAALAPSSAIARVVDLTRVDEFGNPGELLRVTSETICSETPGSWYQTANVLYIHRADGAGPTATTTRVIHATASCVVTFEVNVYIGTENGSRWEIHGGLTASGSGDGAPVRIQLASPTNTARKVVVLDGVSMPFAGRPGNGTNALTVDSWYGVVAAFNCRANGAAKDAFNAHNNFGSGAVQMLLVNCQAVDMGRTNTSCNAVTAHSASVAVVDIAGRYERGRGGTIRNIGTSKMYALGTTVIGDQGDLALGGSIPATAVRVDDSAIIWAERVRVKMPPTRRAWDANSAGSTINRKDCPPTGRPDSGSGTFGTF